MATFDKNDMEKFTSHFGVTINTREIDPRQEVFVVGEIGTEIRNGNLACLFDRYFPLVVLIEKDEKGELKSEVKSGIIDIIVAALDQISRELSALPDSNPLTSLSSEDQKQLQLEVGVTLWLTYKALEDFGFISRSRELFTVSATGRGKKGGGAGKKTPGSSAGTGNAAGDRIWIKGREKILKNLKPILRKNLSQLWNGNRSLSDTKIFLTLVCMGLVNALKYGHSDFLRDHQLSDLLLENFDGLIKNYDKEEQLVENLMFNVLESEDVSKAVAMILTGLRSEPHNNTDVIRKAMQRAFDIIRQPENEDKCERGFTPFLLEIGTHFPEEIRKHSLPFVLSFMETDNATLRGVVLSIVVEIIAWNLKEINDKKTTKEDSAGLREELLQSIFSLMRDTNSTIRTRAIQSASALLHRHAIEPEEAVLFVEEAAERILDIAITTRKNAFQFVRDVLSSYSLVAKLSPAQIRTKVLQERRIFIIRRLEGVKELDVSLRLVIKEFTQQIAKTKMGVTILAQPAPPELESADTAMDYIRQLLRENKFWEACEMFYRCVSTFADTNIFSGFKNHSYDLYNLYFSKELGLTATEEDEPSADLDNAILETDEVLKRREFISSLTAFEVMSEVLANSIIPGCLKLLERGSSGDQSEALLLFSTLKTCEYQLPQNITTSILRIVSTADRKTISNMLEPFNAIFFSKDDCRSDLDFVNALINLVQTLGPDLRTNVNALIEEMLIQKKLHVPGLRILWDYVALRIDGKGESEAKQALYILGVCGEAQKSSIKSIYTSLITETLGERGKADMEFAALGLKAISAYLLKNPKDENEINHTKIEHDNILFQKIVELIEYCLNPGTRDNVNYYFAKVIERGISLIYKCCLEPAEILVHLVEKCYGWTFFDFQNPPALLMGMMNGNGVPSSTQSSTQSQIPSSGSQFSQCPSQSQPLYEYEIPEDVLYKFIIFAGALVGSHISFHGTYIVKELKRRKTLAHIENSNVKKHVKERLRKSFIERNNQTPSSFVQTPTNKSVSTPSNGSTETSEIDELEAVIGQLGYDKEQEQVRGFTEGLLDAGTIKFCWQFAQDVCRNYGSLSSLQIKVAAIRFYGKCMLVGLKAMQNGLRTFLRLWHTVPSPEEKVELILATLLLNEKYPGKLDDCNALVIQELRSQHLLVRQVALDFVTFLTLNDVLKLRDILPETIICLADESHQMRDITKQFLRLCYEKDTMLHSVIPDLIIRCSSRGDLNAESYRTIMKSLLGTLKKVTETTGIAEKLIDRFNSRQLQRGREVQDNAFCLSVLPYNERMFKKIREGIPIYGQYLDDRIVTQYFMDILQSARENAKPELRQKIDEYESQLIEARDNAVELKRMERRKNGEKTDSEAEDSGEDEGPNKNNDKSGSDLSENERREANGIQSSATSNTSDSDDEEVQPKRRSAAPARRSQQSKTRRSKAKVVVVKREHIFTSEEESEGNSEIENQNESENSGSEEDENENQDESENENNDSNKENSLDGDEVVAGSDEETVEEEMEEDD